MTRKSALSLLIAFAHLSALPGCLNFPRFTHSTADVPTKIYDQADVNSTEPKYASRDPANHSTAQARDEHATTSKMPDRTAKDVRPIVIEPRERDAGLTKPPTPMGIVTVEMSDPRNDVSLVQLDKKGAYPLIAALEAMLKKQPDEALQHLRAYDQETQEIILRLAPVLVMVVQTPIKEMTTQEIAIVNEQLWNTLIQFRSRSELTVSKLCFCKEVRGFGAYTPLADNHAFVVGTKEKLGEQVQLYVELRNFSSEKTKEGDFLTKLVCGVELYDAAGRKVWIRGLERIETARRTRMNDFHRNFIFYVPPVVPGTYQLTVHITDETNPEQRRVARESVVFRVTPVAN